MKDWEAVTMDVETAFLYGDLEEEIFMKLPEGFQECVEDLDPNIWCARLLKAMYGLVQAACQWWKKYSRTCRT